MAIDVFVELAGAVLENTVYFISDNMFSRENKLKRGLKKVKDKPCVINEGEFKKDKTFHITQKIEVNSFSYEIKEDTLLIFVTYQDPIEIDLNSLERMFTGRKGKDMVCINTNDVDYLIQII